MSEDIYTEELRQKIERLRAEIKAERERVRVLRGALRELVSKRHDMDLAWFFADEILEATEPEGGEV